MTLLSTLVGYDEMSKSAILGLTAGLAGYDWNGGERSPPFWLAPPCKESTAVRLGSEADVDLGPASFDIVAVERGPACC